MDTSLNKKNVLVRSSRTQPILEHISARKIIDEDLISVPKKTQPFFEDAHMEIFIFELICQIHHYLQATEKRIPELLNSSYIFCMEIEPGISTFKSTCFALSVLKSVS